MKQNGVRHFSQIDDCPLRTGDFKFQLRTSQGNEIQGPRKVTFGLVKIREFAPGKIPLVTTSISQNPKCSVCHHAVLFSCSPLVPVIYQNRKWHIEKNELFKNGALFAVK